MANPEKELEVTGACPATSSAWRPHGIFFPIPPSNELWVLLYYLVRHWLILEPWVFIQDRLDSETLDVWDSCSQGLTVCGSLWDSSKYSRSQVRPPGTALLRPGFIE